MDEVKKQPMRYAKIQVLISKRTKGEGFYAPFTTKSKMISIHKDLDLLDFHAYLREKAKEYIDAHKECTIV